MCMELDVNDIEYTPPHLGTPNKFMNAEMTPVLLQFTLCIAMSIFILAMYQVRIIFIIKETKIILAN